MERSVGNIQSFSDFVYICSRNPIVVWAIERSLASGPSTSRIGTWSPNQLLKLPQGVHILLIDVSSISEWPEAVRKWTSAGHRAIVLVPESWGSSGAELRALYMGVRGIVYASGEFFQLLWEAVNRVANGQLFASGQILDEFYGGNRRLRSRTSAPYLSFREEQVIDLLLKGFSNRRIGTILGISERTAKFHVCNILHKVGVTSRKELLEKDAGVIFPTTSERHPGPGPV
jgi:DNA-binding NarL/FixJ family response regulator